ncbi:guanine deaminase [Castellaniella sp.]|uniref:guanine deaminase n=1 Tax=Castellaniella sp. TaxID=1955812 RepID=UPI00356A2DD1
MPQQYSPDPAQAAYRAQLLYFRDDPQRDEEAVVWIRDGLLIVQDGEVLACGEHAQLARTLAPGVVVHDWHEHLIVPGFVDAHIHYPQTDMIASPAESLLPWLETWTYPTERRFEDPGYAREVAGFFLDELVRCGTTTALVYCSVHPGSAEAFFEASHARGLRMIAGKVMMDRNCPDYLQDTAEQGARDSEALLRRWHGTGRQLYALTPRFAPTSSAGQLGRCGELARAYPDAYIQSHVAESRAEVDWAMALFPGHRSYLDIYDRHGLLRPGAVYGHCIWLDDDDRCRLRDSGAVAAHCPTSNLFLGSGLFDHATARAQRVPVALGTDVGGGTSFSMLSTMNEAHKVARLTGHHLTAQRMFWLATQGAARHLGLSGRIGTLAPGAEADFVVLDPRATPLLARRSEQADALEELLFALAMLGDDRAVAATYAAGREVHRRD